MTEAFESTVTVTRRRVTRVSGPTWSPGGPIQAVYPDCTAPGVIVTVARSQTKELRMSCQCGRSRHDTGAP